MKKVLLINYNEINPFGLDAKKRDAIFFDDSKQFLLIDLERNVPFNLMEFVGDTSKKLADKLNELESLKERFKYIYTDYRPLTFDIYHQFPTDLSKYSMSRQLREINLAIDVIKIIKRGPRKYAIDLSIKKPGRGFMELIEHGLTDHRLNELGFNYRKDAVSFKTFIFGADKLVKDQMITPIRYNEIMEKLEEASQEKIIAQKSNNVL